MMTTETTPPQEPETTNPDTAAAESSEQTSSVSYRIQFRASEQIFSAMSRIPNLKAGEIVMVQAEHGLEPATVIGFGPSSLCLPEGMDLGATYTLVRRGTRDEIEKYYNLIQREKEAFGICKGFIEKHKLAMKLIKVEQFFNGSKIIFYFTAENRVDFRELVKDLVQEFRTRVEIRQIGVRHETKMIGGLGCCGRELCCCSYIKKFAPVSIKMAKEQNLPLNPAKISGICNRLLCCLTYEYDTYNSIRKSMPKIGKIISLDGCNYKVLQHNVMEDTITVIDADNPDKPVRIVRDAWEKAQSVSKPRTEAGGGNKPAKRQAIPQQKDQNSNNRGKK